MDARRTSNLKKTKKHLRVLSRWPMQSGPRPVIGQQGDWHFQSTHGMGLPSIRLVGQSPQICTVSHGRTFEYQHFSNFRYAIFQYKSQKWMPKDDLSV